MSKGFLGRCRYERDHLKLLYYCSFVLKSKKTLRQAQFAAHAVEVFWLHRTYLHLSDFLF